MSLRHKHSHSVSLHHNHSHDLSLRYNRSRDVSLRHNHPQKEFCHVVATQVTTDCVTAIPAPVAHSGVSLSRKWVGGELPAEIELKF